MQETYIIRVLNYSVELTVIHCRVHVDCDSPWFSPRDGKQPLLLGSSQLKGLFQVEFVACTDNLVSLPVQFSYSLF